MLGRRTLSSAARVLPAAASLLGHAILIATTLTGSTLLLKSTTFAQASTSLRGTVTDPSGGTVAGAQVVLTNNESKGERAATTGEQGEYQFLFLPPGSYSLRVTATGFQRYQLTAVQLLVNTPATVNLQLKVGVATETVNVAEHLLPGRH